MKKIRNAFELVLSSPSLWYYIWNYILQIEDALVLPLNQMELWIFITRKCVQLRKQQKGEQPPTSGIQLIKVYCTTGRINHSSFLRDSDEKAKEGTSAAKT